jgi:hypothetical protein
LSDNKLIVACCLLSVSCGFGGAFLFHEIFGIGIKQPQILKAKAIVLVDDSGSSVAYWGHDKKGKLGLTFYGDAYHQAASLGVDGSGNPFLEFRDHADKTRLLLQYVSNEGPSLVFMDHLSRGRLSLGASVSDTVNPVGQEDDNWGLLFEKPGAGAQASVEVWREPSAQYSSARVVVVDNSGKAWTLPPTSPRSIDHK